MSGTARAYKTSGLVLRGRAYGEADRILTLLTTERGKIDVIAKGVRRTKSPMSGRLEFGSEVLLEMHRGRSLDVVVSAEIAVANWQHLVAPEHFAAATLIAELVDAFCEPEMAVPDVYDLLGAGLRAIGASSAPMMLVPRFSLRLLDALGLAPPVESCVQCGRPLGAACAWLDLEQGGFSGAECHAAWRQMLALDADDLCNLRAVAAVPGGAVRPSMHALPRVAQAIDGLVRYHLGRRPKAGLHAAEFVRVLP